jgi:hypothetical protein
MTLNQFNNRSKLNALMLNELETRGHKFTKSDMGYYIGNVLGAFDVYSLYCMTYTKAQMRAEFDRVFGTDEEPSTIQFSDGYKFEQVSYEIAEKIWNRTEVYGIRLGEESEALIQCEEDLNDFDTFGIEYKVAPQKSYEVTLFLTLPNTPQPREMTTHTVFATSVAEAKQTAKNKADSEFSAYESSVASIVEL